MDSGTNLTPILAPNACITSGLYNYQCQNWSCSGLVRRISSDAALTFSGKVLLLAISTPESASQLKSGCGISHLSCARSLNFCAYMCDEEGQCVAQKYYVWQMLKTNLTPYLVSSFNCSLCVLCQSSPAFFPNMAFKPHSTTMVSFYWILSMSIWSCWYTSPTSKQMKPHNHNSMHVKTKTGVN